jgi:predicted ATPase/HPt (histidine-containing phosphotransfer) domain-containing protein
MLNRHFAVAECIHRSPSTSVYRARRLADDRAVVIKTTTAESPARADAERLAHEHALLRRLRGDGVISVLALDEIGARVVLVLDDEGHDRLRRGAPLALDGFLSLAIGVARALERVHSLGVVHCDINPDNLLVRSGDGDVRIIDFGIARDLAQLPREPRETMEGTLAYISPEQTGRVNQPVDHRSDLYSLGVTLYELVGGERPYTADDAIGYVHSHLSKPVPDVRSVRAEVPGGIAAVIARLMAKDAAARYQTAAGLLHDLVACRERLAATGTVAEFALGSRDGVTRLEMAAQLVEREPHLERLAASSARLILVAGGEGMGKTALLDAARARLADEALVVGVRCDERLREVPLGVVSAALGELTAVFQAGSADELAAWKRDITAAVAPNGRVLCDVVPDLVEVLGPQPEVASVALRQAEVRRAAVLRAFLGCVAARRRVVLCFDDLHAADAPTLELLEKLATAIELGELTIVCAYRPDLDGPAALASVAGAVRIALEPLGEAGVTEMLAFALRAERSDVAALGAHLHAKTGGNPLFVRELVERLHREGAIRLDLERGRWQWDEAAIARSPVHASVAEAMLGIIERLSPDARRVLEVAACLGDAFDEDALARLGEAEHAGPAVREGLAARVILATSAPGFHFAHGRIRNALHQAMDAGARARAHARVARDLLDRLDPAERERRLFEIVAHLRAAGGQIASPDAREEALELELAAAARSRLGGGHAIAARHLESALARRSEREWADHPAERFKAAWEHAECVLLAGDAARAHALCEELRGTCAAPRDVAAVQRLRALIYELEARLPDAMTAILEGLAAVGVVLPTDPATIGAGLMEGVGKLVAALARTPARELVALPEMTDATQIATLELLYQLVPSAYQLNPALFLLTELTVFDLSIAHGVTAISAKAFVDCGLILTNLVGDHAGAIALAAAGLALIDRFAPTPLAGSTFFVDATFISPWRDEIADNLAALDRARRTAAELGDPYYATYAASLTALVNQASGTPLAECKRLALAAGRLADESGAQNHQAQSEHQLEAIDALMDPAGVERLWRARAGAPSSSDTLNALANLSAAMVAFVVGDLERARSFVASARALQQSIQGLFMEYELLLVHGLVLGASFRDQSPEEQLASLAELEAITARLAAAAGVNPRRFCALHRLVSAEHARAQGQAADRVAALYEQAVEDAGSHYLHLRAIAYERHAGMWTERGLPRLGRPLLVEAHRLYERWGAATKARALEKLEPSLRPFARGDGAADATTTKAIDVGLDAESVAKITHAIASEVKTDRLFAALMNAIIENVGAERGCLLMSDGDELVIEVTATSDGAAQADRRALSGDVAVARDVVRYVAHSRKAVAIDNAQTHDRFRHDRHVRDAGVRSLLCVPILNRGELLGILYAENNAMSHAFTARHTRLSWVIAGQAATSIQNARLFEDLERRVAARTRELAERNREITALLDNLRQGVLTVDRSLCIEPRYSAHLPAVLGLDDPAGHDVMTAFFAGTDVSEDRIVAHRSALAFSFGIPAELALINWHHLVGSFERRSADQAVTSFECDWSALVDDAGAIVRILATIRDVTTLKNLERAVEERRRDIELILQVLDAGPRELRVLLDDARRRNVESEAALGAGDLDLVFRNLHTIKGNARVLGLHAAAAAAHTAEEALAALADDPGPEPRVLRELGLLGARLDEYEHVLEHKLGDLAKGDDGRARAALAAIAAEVEGARDRPGEAGRALDRVAAALARHDASSIDGVVGSLARMFPSLAEELGKPAPRLEVRGGDVRVAAPAARSLYDALVHVLRNAFDHGIELAEERAAAGKPAAGTIQLDVESDSRGVTLRVRDDGRGLGLDRLRERAGAHLDDEALARSIFSAGLSTSVAVTQVSGRGVGMDAVRAGLEARGGSAEIAFTGPSSAGYRPFELILRLPPDAVVAGLG